jgi:hypothetical protein
MVLSPEIVELPDLVWEGIGLFNAGKYFEAHEVLETAWRAENKPVRRLYQGILQAGITYYHVRRGNRTGALKLVDRALPHLLPWHKMRSPVDIEDLIHNLKQIREFLITHPEKERLQGITLQPIRVIKSD